MPMDSPDKVTDDLVLKYLGASSGGVTGGVVYDGGSHPDVAAISIHDYERVGSQQKINTFGNTPCTAKIATPPAPRFVEVQGPLKKVYIIADLGKDKKKELEEIMNGKTKVQNEYTMNSFAAKDFMNMKNMHEWYEENYVDKIMCLIRDRQLAYPDTHDVADRIMDLNFYKTFKDRYADLRDLANAGVQTKLMNHLPVEVLRKESWVFEGQNENMKLKRNRTGAACGSYSLAYIKCLLTGTKMTVCSTLMWEKCSGSRIIWY
ncbi:hypothetical protein FXO38_29787 [Capsicum annuum]|nr:hypothetical protein FXO38_29787 [Capsicum annuum]KAF3685252.1 hypothetical protein FXO37_00816 [Capsicum annuum]